MFDDTGRYRDVLIPQRRLLALSGIWTGIALVAAFVPTARIGWQVAGALLVGAAMADAWLARRAATGLEVRRETPRALSVGLWHTVTLAASRANTPGLWCDSRPRADRRRCGARTPAVLSASGLRRPAVLSGASVRARHRPSGPSARASQLAARAVAQPANGRGGHEHSRLPGLRSNRALHVARHRQSSLADRCLAATPTRSRTGVPPAPRLPARRLSAPDRLERHGTGQTAHRP